MRVTVLLLAVCLPIATAFSPSAAHALRHMHSLSRKTVCFGGEKADAPLSDAQITLIRSTWGAAEGLGVDTVGVLLFKNIFEATPEAAGARAPYMRLLQLP
jgi:hypothetical protein